MNNMYQNYAISILSHLVISHVIVNRLQLG